MRKVVIIPKGIDLVELFSKNGVRQERSKKRLKDKIYYFLSKVVTHDQNINLYIRDNGYRTISMKKMDELFGSRDSRYVLKILTDPNDPIVESNNSYQVGKNSKGYKLIEKYRTGEIEFKTLGEDISIKLKELEIDDPSLPDYSFLMNQFYQNKLELSNEFIDYLTQLGTSLMKVSNNEYHENLIYNHIGKLLVYQRKIEIGQYYFSLSHKNHRFYSILTNLPRSMRGFLQIDDKQLIEVDLGSSQPYILAILLKELDYLTNIKNNYTSLDNCNTGTYTPIYTYLNSINNNLIYSLLPFMLRTFKEIPKEIKSSIKDFYQIPFHNDFYNYIKNKTGDKVSRDEIKEMLMFFLFDDNTTHRYHNKVIKVMNELYPGVNHLINSIHKEFGASNFSKFLQMLESHLLINLVIREIHDLYPHVTIFTVHDSVLTTSEFTQLIKDHLEKRLFEITSIYPRVKIKSPVPLKMVVEEDLNKIWSDIKSVNTKQKYSKKSVSIFYSTLLHGKKFFDPNL